MSAQAAYLDSKGAQLRLGEAQQYKASDNEVVIKNHALAVNPVDWKVQDSGFFVKEYPTILGCDVAGEVVEIGNGITRFKIGDRVIGHATGLVTQELKHTSFQTYTAVPNERLAKLPNSVSFEQGVVLPLAVSTAAAGLYRPAKDGFLGLPYPSPDGKSQKHNKIIVVYGASSSVGAVTVQLAVASGARVVALASEKNFEFVRSVGAAEIVDYKDPNAVQEVVEAVKKLGGDFVGVYDAINGGDAIFDITVPILKALGGGSLATVLQVSENLPSNIKAGLVFSINPSTDPVWLDYLEPALASGQFKPVPEPLVIGTGLENVQEGLWRNKRGVSARKVVIRL